MKLQELDNVVAQLLKVNRGLVRQLQGNFDPVQRGSTISSQKGLRSSSSSSSSRTRSRGIPRAPKSSTSFSSSQSTLRGSHDRLGFMSSSSTRRASPDRSTRSSSAPRSSSPSTSVRVGVRGPRATYTDALESDYLKEIKNTYLEMAADVSPGPVAHKRGAPEKRGPLLKTGCKLKPRTRLSKRKDATTTAAVTSAPTHKSGKAILIPTPRPRHVDTSDLLGGAGSRVGNSAEGSDRSTGAVVSDGAFTGDSSDLADLYEEGDNLQDMISTLESEFSSLNQQYKSLLNSVDTAEETSTEDLVSVIQAMQRKGQRLRALKHSPPALSKSVGRE